MSSEIWCAIISGVVTLLVSIITCNSTFKLTVKKDRDTAKAELQKRLDDNYEKTRKSMEDLKDDLSQIEAVVQQQIAIQSLKIETLSKEVEKHNNVIERMFKLEQKVEDMRKAM